MLSRSVAWQRSRCSSACAPTTHGGRRKPLARLERLDLDAAVVAFTSTDCSNCKKVMRMLGGLGVTVREVTFELEPGLFEAAGVEGVPLVVVARRDGNAAVQFGGSVRRAAVARALRRAGS